jgi:hypothetical protein
MGPNPVHQPCTSLHQLACANLNIREQRARCGRIDVGQRCVPTSENVLQRVDQPRADGIEIGKDRIKPPGSVTQRGGNSLAFDPITLICKLGLGGGNLITERQLGIFEGSRLVVARSAIAIEDGRVNVIAADQGRPSLIVRPLQFLACGRERRAERVATTA